jgi:hypothetical protein
LLPKNKPPPPPFKKKVFSDNFSCWIKDLTAMKSTKPLGGDGDLFLQAKQQKQTFQG